MTVTAAAFADAPFRDRPVLWVGRAGALFARHLFLATAAATTTGITVLGLMLGVGWLASTSLMQRHGERTHFGPRSLALAPAYPGEGEPARPADIVVFPLTIAAAAPPLHLVERMPRPRPRIAARANVVPVPPAVPPELASLRMGQRLASLPPAPPPAAAAHVAVPLPAEKPASGEADNHTAVYDISARAVYLPNGKRLEAHSGLGDLRDDPRYIRVRRQGPTPPNTYDLSLREGLFHGVRAIRLTPVNEDKMFGRDGMLAHTYMLGPDGDSNGCVSFKDYSAFLQAYLKGDVDRLVVVAGNGATLARGGSGTRFASSAPGPSSPRFSARE